VREREVERGRMIDRESISVAIPNPSGHSLTDIKDHLGISNGDVQTQAPVRQSDIQPNVSGRKEEEWHRSSEGSPKNF
jgi:hypothetical protein